MLDKMKHKFKKWDIVMYTMLNWIKKKVMVIEPHTNWSYLVLDKEKEVWYARDYSLKLITDKESSEEDDIQQ